MRRRIAIIVPTFSIDQALERNLERWLALEAIADISIVLVGGQEGEAVSPTLQRSCDCVPFHRPASWIGRDANARRSLGLKCALAHHAPDFVLMTDRKVSPTQSAIDCITRWVRLADPDYFGALAGHYRDTAQRRDPWSNFLARYADHALVRKNPDFGTQGYLLSLENENEGDSWPVTGALMFTRATAELLERAGGFPESFRVSYEDYSTVRLLIERGVEIDCHPDFLVEHTNRNTLQDFAREYLRTGWAAAQFRRVYPRSDFGRRRLVQAQASMLALIAGLLLMLASPLIAVAVALIALLGFGALNAWRSRLPEALFFGPVFAVCLTAFACGYGLHLLRRGRLGPLEGKLLFQA
ncbi:glycosyltransferase family 2 protein [Rhizobium sp. AAP43]|uniref:glycosyltransferase n=1 Tax=Rhizobium sp. AAP43 TaxID=1523420 RepID=UPI0006B90574|nr:glycosyltransferase [Rhizobium sp. AAP43]KPF41613.1 hypothetical protein IP76_20410 [Rhizobium sp. AAP43]